LRSKRTPLERQIADLERELRTGQAEPEALLRLGRLYLRAGRSRASRDALRQARERLNPLAQRTDGGVELRAEWTELQEELERVEADVAREERSERRAELLARLAEQGLDPASHDELIQIELTDGYELHPEPARCPACQGPLARVGEEVRCARSGRQGDLCRHTDAQGLHQCDRCGQVLRAWSVKTKGKLIPNPHEPPLGLAGKPRCAHCDGLVADWRRHYMHCPKARPRDFPVCDHCRKRGFHARMLECPRCRHPVVQVDCLE
jgi:hypothetical protein